MPEEKPQRTKTQRAFTIIGLIIGILIVILLLKYVDVFSGISIAVSSLQALIFGIIFACVMSPMLKWFEDLLSKKLSTPEKPRENLVRGIGIALTLAVTVAVVVLILLLVIPQVGITLQKIIPSFRSMVNEFSEWLKGLSDGEMWQERAYPMVQEFIDGISQWVLSLFGSSGSDVLSSLTSSVMSVINVIFNMVIGLILSAYLLFSREKLFAQIEKLCMAVFRKKWGTYIMDAIDEGARIFSGFFGAKIIEAILMGGLCFVGMMILQLPYATLISVIVGVANVIPFFGPYIGALIGAGLIVLVDPWQALIFIIFQVVLVQFDANFMGPKIIGHSTGLSALWVIVAILLFSGSFGIMGAFIGVPLFAWIYYIVGNIANYFLEKQGLPTSTQEYEDQREQERLEKEKAAQADE